VGGRQKKETSNEEAVATKKKEAHERTSERQKQQNYRTIATEHAAELDRIRHRTAELRDLRLAHERRGKVRRTMQNARIAKSATKEE